MIPNIIHFIFFGFTDFEYIHSLAIKSAHRIHKPKKIYLYYSKRPENNSYWQDIEPLVELVHVEPPEEFMGVKLDSYQYKADVLRLQKLQDMGGIYLDIDVISLRSFGDLLNEQCVLGVESGGDDAASAESVTNAVILTEPNHPFICDWLSETGKNLEDKNWAYHGVNLPAEMLRKNQYSVRLEPRQSFMPFGWRDRWIFEPGQEHKLEGAYTMHLWETIWRDDLNSLTVDSVRSAANTLTSTLKPYAKPLKIAVYTICKNENQFVDRWADSNQEADIRLVCDTGSTDNTAELLEQKGVTVFRISVMPWRFDTARGTALNLLPADVDICIWQDLDEELLPGWRQQLEQHWQLDATIANHRYRHNDGVWQWHSKIHRRHGCRWTGAVHETLSWAVPEKTVWIPEFYLDEHQDVSKPRSSYLNLLLKKIREGDRNWRTYYFLANDYQMIGDWTNSVKHRKQAYDLCEDGDIIKSYVARNIARQYADRNDRQTAEKWFMISVNHSAERESWFSLCQYYYNNQDWDQCFLAAKKCLTITERRDGFTHDSQAWGWMVYDYAALSAYRLGMKSQAQEYGTRAVEMNPSDQRLKKNQEFYNE